jgi:hypothetical protein
MTVIISDDMMERLRDACGKEGYFIGVTTANKLLTAALEGSVAVPVEKALTDEIVWLREIDAGTDNACWVISNRSDRDSVPFYRGADVTRKESGGAAE